MEQFITDVSKMREAQKKCFLIKTNFNLATAKHYEIIVDKKLKDLQRSEKVPVTGELFKSDNL